MSTEDENDEAALLRAMPQPVSLQPGSHAFNGPSREALLSDLKFEEAKPEVEDEVKPEVEDEEKPEVKPEVEDDDEFGAIFEYLKKINEPGVWAVVFGPTCVVSMVNMMASGENFISDNANSFAKNLAGGHSAYSALTLDDEKYEWISRLARGTDQYNRKLDAGTFLRAAVSAANGAEALVYSDQPAAKGKNYNNGAKWGRRIQHYPTVRGWLAMALNFKEGNTESLVADAKQLEPFLSKINDDAASMHPALSVYKIQTHDLRKSLKRKRDDDADEAPVVDEWFCTADPNPFVPDATRPF